VKIVAVIEQDMRAEAAKNLYAAAGLMTAPWLLNRKRKHNGNMSKKNLNAARPKKENSFMAVINPRHQRRVKV
jgi:hypothetical protein